MTFKPRIGLLTKIFAILFMSTIFMQFILIFPIGPGFRNQLPHLMSWHLSQYMALAVEKIGNPRDAESLARTAEQIDSDIRVEDRDGLAIVDGGLPPYSDVKQNKDGSIVGMFLNIPAANINGRLLYTYETPDYKYVFSPRRFQLPNFLDRSLRFAILVTLLPVLISFLLIRIILKPIQTLKIALETFGSGDLTARANIHQHDELGALAANFNKMADEINNILTARQQLVSDVSHELRSPIARLKMAIESIQASPIKTDLADDIEELQSLTDTILDAERIRSGVSTPTLEEFNIISLIHEIKNQLKTNHKISLEGLPTTTNVIADKRWAKIVLRNVIENAAKYSNPESKPIQVTVDISDEFCEICVKDYGVGIAKEDLEKVFEPFYRVDSSRTKASGGFGIGLHLCKRIMTALGGSIAIDSSKGEWTKVRLKFLL